MKRALALSLLVHGVFLLYAALQPARPLLPTDSPIQLAFFEIFKPPAEVPPPPPEPEKPAPKPPPKAPVVAMTTPPPQQPAEPEQAEQPDEPRPPPSDMPRLDTPLRLPGITEGGNGIVLPLSMLTIDAGVEVQIAERRPGLHAPEIPKDLVGSTAKEAVGRGRVARGMVHPYYVELGKTLIKQWDADRAVSGKGLKGFIDQTIENNRIWQGIWQEKAGEYGKSGSPFAKDDDRPNVPMRPYNDRMTPYGGNAMDQAARRELNKQMAESFRATRRATIRVVQNREGKLTKVELVEPSNDEHVDREAVEDVRAAAMKLPPPPADAIEGKDELSSLWSFELVVSITPPVPTFTFEFDEVIGFIDARMPLDRRIYKKVKLVSVE